MVGVRAVSEQRRPEQSAPGLPRAGFVLGLDVGSSVIRCHVYDHAALIRGSSAQKVTGERASGPRVTVAQSMRDRVAGGERVGPPHQAACSHLQHRRALGPEPRTGSGQIPEFPPRTGLTLVRPSCSG